MKTITRAMVAGIGLAWTATATAAPALSFSVPVVQWTATQVIGVSWVFASIVFLMLLAFFYDAARN